MGRAGLSSRPAVEKAQHPPHPAASGWHQVTPDLARFYRP